jgi:Rhodopirellula transposase DDE domain
MLLDEKLFLKVLATLSEAQARWWIARETLARGRGGLKAMHQLTGMSRPTILRGIREVRGGRLRSARERIREPGGGRRRIEEHDPAVMQALERIMQETTAGDPMSLLRWTCKSTAMIAEELGRQRHIISADTVGRRLRELGYSLQSNVKTKEGRSAPQRDEQFRYINRQVQGFVRRGQPVLSVDTKKKELVGAFKNAGRTWRSKGKPQEVNVYDYPSLAVGAAIPYGAYDVARNEGFVNVGISHDTAEFAVESIRRWWRLYGRRHYPEVSELLICADGGGSNGNRNRAWKYFLQRLADDHGLSITVCHYPPGTSKWNKIEHRMFSFISLHWKGEPLVSYQTIINLISTTTTKTGLRIRAKLDPRIYESGLTVSDDEMKGVKLSPHRFHPEWNYSIAASEK